MQIAEEVFGSVFSVLSISDFEEAVKVANDVKFDLSKGHQFAEDAEAGIAKIKIKNNWLGSPRTVRRL